jgi:hypothetical protein
MVTITAPRGDVTPRPSHIWIINTLGITREVGIDEGGHHA